MHQLLLYGIALAINNKKTMRTDKGKPSGINKGESHTGVPSNPSPEKIKNDREISEKYTEDENEIGKNVHVTHPNRNTDKEESTNIGGYRT
jgi:hypothetical protein